MNRNEQGFTLIETLVAINLMFIVLTFCVSFYLFTSRYTESLIINVSDKQNVNTMFFYMHQSLNKTDNYILNVNKDDIFIYTDKGDSIIIIKDEIRLNDNFSIYSIEEMSIKLHYMTNEILDLNPNSLPFKEKLIYSRDISSIEFSFISKGKAFKREIFIYNNSSRRFKNKSSTLRNQYNYHY